MTYDQISGDIDVAEVRIETSYHLSDPDLLAVREPDVQKWRQFIGDNPVTVAGKMARSGSSSTANLLAEHLQREGKIVKHIRTVYDLQQEARNIERLGEGGVVIVEEASSLLPSRSKSRDDERATRLLFSSLQQAVKNGVQFVFMSHGGWDNNTKTSNDAKTAELLEKQLELEKPVPATHLESPNKEMLGKIFDIFAQKMNLERILGTEGTGQLRDGGGPDLPDGLVRQCTIPQQIAFFFDAFQKAKKEKKTNSAAIQAGVVATGEGIDGYTQSAIRDSIEDVVRTTGGEQLWTIIKKVASTDRANQQPLSDEETELVNRYSWANLLSQDANSKYVINGKVLHDYALVRLNR